LLKEHLRLIKILETGTRSTQRKEAALQKIELKKYKK